jgi:hypothetical protein
MALSKAGDKAKAISTIGLMARFVQKLDARRTIRQRPLKSSKT